MRIYQSRDLIQEQTLQIHLPPPLLQLTRAVRDDVHQLVDEDMIRRELAVPRIHKVPNDDGDEGVELQVDLIRAGQGGQELLDGAGSCSILRMAARGAENASDESRRGLRLPLSFPERTSRIFPTTS